MKMTKMVYIQFLL